MASSLPNLRDSLCTFYAFLFRCACHHPSTETSLSKNVVLYLLLTLTQLLTFGVPHFPSFLPNFSNSHVSRSGPSLKHFPTSPLHDLFLVNFFLMGKLTIFTQLHNVIICMICFHVCFSYIPN